MMTPCTGCGRPAFDIAFLGVRFPASCLDCSYASFAARRELIARHHDEYQLLVAMYLARRSPHGEAIQ